MYHQDIAVSTAINHFGLINAPQLVRKLNGIDKSSNDVIVVAW